MQFPRLSAGSFSAPVVEAVCQIRILLHLCQKYSRADRVQGSGGYRNDISRRDRYSAEDPLYASVEAASLKFCGSERLFKPVNDRSARRGIDDKPAFGLPALTVFVSAGEIVVRMNLYRKTLRSVNEFYQNPPGQSPPQNRGFSAMISERDKPQKGPEAAKEGPSGWTEHSHVSASGESGIFLPNRLFIL